MYIFVGSPSSSPLSPLPVVLDQENEGDCYVIVERRGTARATTGMAVSTAVSTAASTAASTVIGDALVPQVCYF